VPHRWQFGAVARPILVERGGKTAHHLGRDAVLLFQSPPDMDTIGGEFLLGDEGVL